MKTLMTGFAALAGALLIQNCSWAQSPSFGTSNRPKLSPYLNLVPERNFIPALNYYRSYQPEVEFRSSEQRLNRSVQTLQREIDQTRLLEQKETSLLGTTGHRTSFHNTSSYFPSHAAAQSRLQVGSASQQRVGRR